MFSLVPPGTHMFFSTPDRSSGVIPVVVICRLLCRHGQPPTWIPRSLGMTSRWDGSVKQRDLTLVKSLLIMVWHSSWSCLSSSPLSARGESLYLVKNFISYDGPLRRQDCKSTTPPRLVSIVWTHSSWNGVTELFYPESKQTQFLIYWG